MSGPESAGSSFELREGIGERLSGQRGCAGCLRWAVDVKYDASAGEGSRQEAAMIIREAVVAYTDTSFQLECGVCEAGCELIFSAVRGEPPVTGPLATSEGITSLLACKQA